MAKGDVFRLYILGQLQFDNPKSTQDLITLAEYGTARKLSRVKIGPGETQKMAGVVRNLRAFMTDGVNPFDETQLVQLGSRLFGMIIGNEVRNLLMVARAAAQFEPVPLEIIVENHAVAGWPWEYLYDAIDANYLCREYYPISRSSFNLDPIPACTSSGLPLRILFVLGASRLDPEAGVAEQLDRHNLLSAGRRRDFRGVLWDVNR